MAKRKVQYLKQKIATVGDGSTKFTRGMNTLARKIARVRAMDQVSQVN